MLGNFIVYYGKEHVSFRLFMMDNLRSVKLTVIRCRETAKCVYWKTRPNILYTKNV